MYGAQTLMSYGRYRISFENDVEMYGAQTDIGRFTAETWFENDVEMYGAQTDPLHEFLNFCLRMM